MMTIMDRSISYQINGLEKPQKISGFLKEKLTKFLIIFS